MCCDRDTEEQLRHQARADFHDLIHHHSRSLQGLLATTADALRGKCNVTSTLELGQAIFLSTNRSRRVKKNLNRLESNKMRGGRRRRKEHTESRLLEIGNCYETTVVFLELAKANLEPCELFPSSHPPSHHSFLFHHLATTFSINHHAVAELLTSSLPSPLPPPLPSPSRPLILLSLLLLIISTTSLGRVIYHQRIKIPLFEKNKESTIKKKYIHKMHCKFTYPRLSVNDPLSKPIWNKSIQICTILPLK